MEWGYYVVPILHRGKLVARFEGRRVDGRLEIENLWAQDNGRFNKRAWKAALGRLEKAL